MKTTLNEVAGMLVYVFEFLVNGEKRSLILKPLDAANGLIVEETEPNSGVYYGETVTGRRVEVPVAAVTNVFPAWWKVLTKAYGNNGYKTVYGDDAWVERHLSRDRQTDSETGEIKDTHIEKKDPPPDAKRYRG